MAFVLFGFQCAEEGEGVWEVEGGAADISLLCKCSFPHKQRGVQNGRVERGESIACAFVSASPINSSPSSPRQSVRSACARCVALPAVNRLPVEHRQRLDGISPRPLGATRSNKVHNKHFVNELKGSLCNIWGF